MLHLQIVLCCTSCVEKRKLTQRLIYLNGSNVYFAEASTLCCEDKEALIILNTGQHLHSGDESPSSSYFMGWSPFR